MIEARPAVPRERRDCATALASKQRATEDERGKAGSIALAALVKAWAR